ncbi:MAG: hypothetical protein GXO27_02550 [Chlorobi bacterium]|nr:hypothetical protein [Chlorobiota bacterium]
MKKLPLLLLLWPLWSWSQVAVNDSGNAPADDAMLDVVSTERGVLIPRMTAAQRDAIAGGSPSTGLTVFVTDDNQFYYYDGTQWLPFGKNDGDWKVSGDDMYSLPTGNVGIGTSEPLHKFTVSGLGDVGGTTDAENGGIAFENNAAPDTGTKMFLDANEIQVVNDGEAAALYVNAFGGAVYFNQSKFGFSGEADLSKGRLLGGVSPARHPMVQYYADTNRTTGNLVILSGDGLTAVSGGEHGYLALMDAIDNGSDLTQESEQVLILADNRNADDTAISFITALQSGVWDDGLTAMKIYGDASIEIVHHYDAGLNSDKYGDLRIGPADGLHLELDDNEIEALSDAETAGTLGIQADGGKVLFFDLDTGYVDINKGYLQIRGDFDAGTNSAAPYASLIIGETDSLHLEIDNNEIIAMDDAGTPSTLYLQIDGGEVVYFNHEPGRVLVAQGFLQLTGGIDGGANSLDNPADLVIGSLDGQHLEIDNNEIISMNNDAAATLYMNADGGTVRFFTNQRGQVSINTSNVDYALTLANDDNAQIGKGAAREWVEYSDARIKSDIRPVENALEKLSLLRPVGYFQHNTRFVEDKETGEIRGFEISEDGERSYGFLAQDLYKVVPEAVHKPKNEQRELWTVHYSELIPILTAAMQEQQKLIQAQREEIRALKERMRRLEEKLNR